MKKILTFILFFISSTLLAEPVKLQYKVDKNYIEINGIHLQTDNTDSVALILHGTRGHQNLELISSIASVLLENNVNSLRVNLSYGINNRNNDFLPCDINHAHKKENSIKEIKLWFNYLKQNNYKKIYLIGHSRGGLNVVQFYNSLTKKDQMHIPSIYLLAPLSDSFKDTSKYFLEKYQFDISTIENNNDYFKIDFLNCPNANVKHSSFLDYYKITNTESGNRGSLIPNLKKINKNIFVFTASDDTFVPMTHKRVNLILSYNKHIELIEIQDADHFFRDFYFDDIMDGILKRMTSTYSIENGSSD